MLDGFWRNMPSAARLRRGLVFGVITVVLLSCWFGASQVVASVPSTAIRYTYTPDSQLSSVIKPEAEYALYTWDAAGNLSSIAKKSSTKLSIIQLEPTKGAVGETIDIWGTGFSTTPSKDTVKFHGTAATVSAATAYTLAVKVPTGATTGTVTVQTTTEGPVTSSQTFTVASAVGAPTITSLSASVAEPGATVTVSGTNFETTASDDIVRVNQTDAEVTSASSTSIKFKVPPATSGGHVSVSTPQGLVSGPDLYIPPEGIATSKVGATEQISAGKSVTIKLSTAETVGLVLLEATEGQHVSLVVSGETIRNGAISVFSPQGTKLGESEESFFEKETKVDQLTMPTTGTYMILVKPEGTYTGSVELTAVTDVTGSITPTTEGAKQAVSITTPYQRALYSVTGTAGEAVSVNISGVSFSGEGGVVELVSSGGVDTNTTGFTKTAGGFMTQVKFLTTGTYTLVVRPYGTSTGSLTLTVYEDPNVTGTITPSAEGETKTITTTIPGQYARIMFSGKEGERISLVLSEGTYGHGYVSILNPEGGNITSREYFGEKANVLVKPVKLPTTGTYTILIEPSEGYTGSVKLAAYSVTDVTGSITPTTEGAKKEVSLKTPGQRALYTVSGTAGETVSVNISSVSFSPEGGEVEWANSAGTILRQDSFSKSEGGFVTQVKFPTTSTYTLIVSPNGVSTGSLTLTVYEASDVTGTITPSAEGEAKTVTTTVPGQYARITFAGKEGEKVSLVLSEATYGYGYVSILNPEGSEVVGRQYFGEKQTVFVKPVKLPTTGTYTILIEPHEPYTGSVKLAAYSVTDVTGSITPTTEGAKKEVALKTPGQRALYTVAGTAGEIVTVKPSNVSFSPNGGIIEWQNPEGQVIREASFGTTEGGFVNQVKFPTTGTYTLIVRPYETSTGSLTLTVYEAPNVTGTITPTSGGEAKTVTLSIPGQFAHITFSGTSSQTITLKADESTIAYGWMSVWNSEGSKVAGLEDFTNSYNGSLEFMLSATGTYTIVLEPKEADTGSVKLVAYLGSHPGPGVVRGPAASQGGAALARPMSSGGGTQLAEFATVFSSASGRPAGGGVAPRPTRAAVRSRLLDRGSTENTLAGRAQGKRTTGADWRHTSAESGRAQRVRHPSRRVSRSRCARARAWPKGLEGG